MKIDVSAVAKLASLTLSPDEEKKFEPQLEAILEYVKKLAEVDTTGIKETSQVTGLENVYREDIAEASLTQEEALSGATSVHNSLIQVKGIFENE